MEKMETAGTVERERLNPFVLPDTARRVKIACATRGMTQGELIDDLAAKYLPSPPAASEGEQ